jgi:hypothetical protein
MPAKLQPQPTTSTTPVKTIQVYEHELDATKLSQNKWNFQIAKSVDKGNGDNNPNVVWQSKNIAPNIFISWKDVYALNWTARIPPAGVSIAISGAWQACNPGDSYDLDNTGYWIPSKKPYESSYDKDFINVGKIDYTYPSVDGIHIVIGLQSSTTSNKENFDIIYVDPISLTPHSSAKYQPQELVRWWYQADSRSSTMINHAITNYSEVDFSAPAPHTGNYYYSTTFHYESGDWVTSEDKPSSSLHAPQSITNNIQVTVPRDLYSIWPLNLRINFKHPLNNDEENKVSAKLGALLKVLRYNAVVTAVDEETFKVEINAPSRARPKSNDNIGTVTDDIIAVLRNLLEFEAACGDLPNGESWTIAKIGRCGL